MNKYVLKLSAGMVLTAITLTFSPMDKACAQEGSINAYSARDLRSDNLLRQRGDETSIEQTTQSASRAIEKEPELPLTPQKTSLIKNYLKLNRDSGYPARSNREDTKLWTRNIFEPKPEEQVKSYLDFVETAVEQMIKGNAGRALKEIDKAIKIDPNRPEAYYNLGLIYFHTGRDPLAIVNFRRAIDLCPNFAEARNNLGVSLVRTKLIDLGIEQFRMANIYAPTMKEPIDNLEQLKYKDTAYNYNDKLIRTKPTVSESSPSRIFSLNLRVCAPVITIPGTGDAAATKEHRLDEESQYIPDMLSAQEKKDLQKRYPQLSQAMAGLVELPNRQNKYWDALNLLKIADELCSNQLYKESINYYDRVIRMIPEDNSEIFYKRGMAKFYMKSFKAAERDFKIALKNAYDNALINESTRRLEDCRRVLFNIRDDTMPNSSL